MVVLLPSCAGTTAPARSGAPADNVNFAPVALEATSGCG
jgi:hypothetical protein